MKRIISTITILILLCIPVSAGELVYKLTPAEYPIYVNGQLLHSSIPPLKYTTNQGDTTMLPLRAVLETMGAVVDWGNNSVYITTPDPEVIIKESRADPKKIANSVVQIYVGKNGRDVVQGSGVIIGYDEIVTCSHVANRGDSYRIIYNDGTTTTAKLVKDNPAYDIAILYPAREDVKPVKIGDSDEVDMGDSVFVVSSPNGEKNAITQGKVLLINESIVSSAKVDEGSSGSGMFSAKTGELIGIIRTNNKDSKYGGAAPINDVRKVK